MKYLVHASCPDFISPTLMEDGSLDKGFQLSHYFKGSYGVIFFFPLAFNFISLTELKSLSRRLEKFAELNTKIVAVSCDSPLALQVWQGIALAEGGAGALHFPMVSDMTRVLAGHFDVLVGNAMPEAAVIIVDDTGHIIFQFRNDTSVGRNIDRILEGIRVAQNKMAQPVSPVEQLLTLEEYAIRLKSLGYNIVAQSVDTPLSHPQWNGIPRDFSGRIELPFPFLDCEQPWPQYAGMTIAVREALDHHSTGLLLPDGQLLFEYHADRKIPRDFDEMLRIGAALKLHLDSGKVIPWENVDGTKPIIEA